MKKFEPDFPIGFTGFAQSGKGTSANIVVKNYGYELRSIGSTLRNIALEINPLIRMSNGEISDYKTLLNTLTYEGAKKEHPEFRRFLINLARGCKRHIYDSVLAEPAFKREEPLHYINEPVEPDNSPLRVVVDDIRFASDSEELYKANGILIMITKPGVKPADPSEQMMLNLHCDYEIQNDGTVAELEAKIVDVIQRECIKRNAA